MLLLILVRAILLSRTSLALDSLALRQRVAVLKGSVPRACQAFRVDALLLREPKHFSKGTMIAVPHLGGLHHSYRRAG